MANKNKWYKSKGGWIGAIVGLLSVIAGMNYYKDTGSTISLFLQYTLYLPLTILDSLHLFIGNTGYILVNSIWGFIVGYFIYNKFFKKRRK